MSDGVINDEEMAADPVVDTGGPAAVYPVKDAERIGVNTDQGTPSSATDDIDENDKIAGTPDDVRDGGMEGDEVGPEDGSIIK